MFRYLQFRKKTSMLEAILSRFGINANNCVIQTFGTGLINNTWKITSEHHTYILQRINTNVFKNPQAIDENIQHISVYLQKNFPDYLFVSPVDTIDGKSLVHTSDGYFRLLPFIKSVSYDVVTSPHLAFEAAKQFGKFTKLLSNFPAEKLQITIPDFHNLSLRYHQFLSAITNG